MSYQNINQYNFNKWYLIDRSDIQDFCLASDEKDYKFEVIFSNTLIDADDGNKLPISFDLDYSGNTEFYVLNYNEYNPFNNLVSSNYYNPKNEDLTCFTANTACDIGLTGTDNGLVEQMTGETITFTQGLFDDSLKFERLYFDRRLKLHQVTGYTQSPNIQFSGLPDTILFNVVSKLEDKVGVYHELYGGFYQGFYKLHGYDYEIFPERVNKGWTVEMLLKPRLVDEYILNPGETTLNTFYPDNKNIFFFFGTRAENKYYHHASGSPVSDTGYTRVTSLLNSIETCACCDSGVTTSRCIYVYPPQHDPAITATTCGWEGQKHACSAVTTTTTVQCAPCEPCLTGCDGTTPQTYEYTCETDPLFDSMSNAIALKLCGDPKNPQIGVRMLRFTGTSSADGNCITGSCSTTGVSVTTGYTIETLCTPKGIYDDCLLISTEILNKERWIQIDAVWERNTYLEDCDLWYKGGLGLITKTEYLASLSNNSISLVTPTNCSPDEKITLSQLNQTWLNEKDFRNGKLKIYVNGRSFYTFENVEEIIPRSLYADKEKQLGVPFSISWGGGTQGLHNNLVLTGAPDSLTGLIYQQDPELFPNNILSGTTLSALTTNILLEQNFGGTFDGGISQFRMYSEPLSADEVKHNYKLLKDKFSLFDYDCPNCCLPNDIIGNISVCDISYEVLSANTITVRAVYSAGSISSTYIAESQFPLDSDIDLSFTNTLGVYVGDPIIIDVSITIESGSSSGTITIITDSDFNNLNLTSNFSGFSTTFTGTTQFGFRAIYDYNFIIPPSPTPTPTPTPTQTPYQVLIDPIITDNGEFISVGENEYLQFVDPEQNIFDAVLTTIGEYISVGFDQFLRFINPSPSQTPTITPTSAENPTQTPTPTNTETPSPTPTQTPTLTPTVTPTQGYKNGLSPETAGDSAYQIKTNYSASTDGLYWIKNDNISGGTPFQIYADMTTDGGGWTLLLVNQLAAGWTYTNALLLNEFNPVISGSNYSIVGYADYLKGNGTTFQYMMEANQRNSYGGIWSAPSSYTFVNTGNTQTSVNLDIKFGDWVYENAGIEQRMPWRTPIGECPYLTTSESPSSEWWGSLITRDGCGFNPAPWISSQIQIPGIIWYWVRNSNPLMMGSPFQLGRNHVKDDRDNNYLISNFYDWLVSVKTKPTVVPTPTPTKTKLPITPTKTPTPSITPSKSITTKYWDDNGWWGNQLRTPMCVGYAWSHWISDGPIVHSGVQPVVAPDLIYREAQKVDEWIGENYDGTSVRGAAKHLKTTGKITSYYWAFDVNTLVNTVLNLGPVVVGTNWYYNMFYPVNGVISVGGYYAGGHAYVINGVDTVKKQFRIKNSWGQTWGINGHAYISFTDMARLISESGEICLAVENNF